MSSGVVRLCRTFSTTSFPGETSVQGAYALDWGGSSVFPHCLNSHVPHNRKRGSRRVEEVRYA